MPSTVATRWRSRLHTRERLLADAEKKLATARREHLHPRANLVLLVKLRKAQVAYARRVVKRHERHRPVQAQGIDVSNNQGHVDFHAVKRAGYEFAYVKATEGVGFTDVFFQGNVRAAKAAGLKVGAYHFLRPKAGRSGAVEAQEFVAALKSAGLGKGDLIPVVDVEVTEIGAGTEGYVDQFVTEFRKLTGRRPLIYTYPAFLLWQSDHGCHLWIAHYDVNKPTIPGPWKGYAIWQHSSKTHVPGVGGNCDVNRCPDLRKVIA